MTTRGLARYYVAGSLLLIFTAPTVSAEQTPVSPETAAEMAERHMPENRAVPLRHQDDHIHTRPDAPVTIFNGLDVDDDEHLQWQEVQPLEMTREEFHSIDANGSGELDMEEYIAISQSPGNDYIDKRNAASN